MCVYVCPQMPTIHTPNPPVMGDSSHVHAGHSPGLASASLPSSDYCIIMMLGESKIVEDAIIDPTAPTPRLWYEITYNVGSNEARGSLFYSRILDSIVVKKAGETSSSMMVMMPNVLSVISIFFLQTKNTMFLTAFENYQYNNNNPNNKERLCVCLSVCPPL